MLVEKRPDLVGAEGWLSVRSPDGDPLILHRAQLPHDVGLRRGALLLPGNSVQSRIALVDSSSNLVLPLFAPSCTLCREQVSRQAVRRLGQLSGADRGHRVTFDEPEGDTLNHGTHSLGIVSAGAGSIVPARHPEQGARE